MSKVTNQEKKVDEGATINLTDREKEVLAGAEYLHRRPNQCPQRLWGYGPGWFTAMYVGGGNRSHHSRTLMKLVKAGLIETPPKLNNYYRPNRRYRITEEGLKMVQSWKARQ